MRSSLREIMGLAVPEGRITITWFNSYSGIVIRTPTSTLIFDPVDVSPDDVPEADAIVITHEHYDHLDGGLAESLQRRTGAVVVTTPFVANQLGRVPTDRLRALRVGESTTVKGTRLDAYRSDHPGRQPLTFMVTTDVGVVVYHSSDSRPFAGMRGLGERHRPDIALCTVGIAPGTSPRSGAEIARLVRPKVAIPYHTDRMGALRRFAEMLRGEPGVRVRVLRRFQVYQYPE